MASTPGVSASLFSALAKANINIRAIAQGCSEYNITVVLKREDCIRALRAVHSRFYLSKTTIAVGIIGPGLIGATLLDQLRDQAGVLKEEFNIDLRVMGIIGSRKMILSHLGIDLSKWRDLQKEKAQVADLEKFVQHVHGHQFIPNTVLVDCTADSNVANHYYNWLCKGIHVVTPNKKANSGPLDWDELKKLESRPLEEGIPPMTEDERFEAVLGPERSAYIRGRGAGPKPTICTAGQQIRAQLERENEEFRRRAEDDRRLFEEMEKEKREMALRLESLESQVASQQAQMHEVQASVKSQFNNLLQQFINRGQIPM